MVAVVLWQCLRPEVTGPGSAAPVAEEESVMEMDLAAGSRAPAREQEKKAPALDPTPTREAESRPIQVREEQVPELRATPPCRECQLRAEAATL